MLSIKADLLNKYLSGHGPLSTNLIAASDSQTFVYHRTNTSVLVKLYTDRIEFYYQSKSPANHHAQPNFILFMQDVAGSMVQQDADKAKNKHVYLTIYAYPKEKYLSQSKSKRNSQIIKLKCTKTDNFVDNLNCANEWHSNLHTVLNRAESPDAMEENKDKPFLVYVNPKAGAGKAQQIYQTQILPVLTEANVPNTLVLTTHANFVREEVKKLNLNDYRGIIAVSGDGLLYEIFNGLMERADWEQAIKTPVAQIPGGSANALACCNAHLTNEVFRDTDLKQFARQTTFNLVKSQSMPLDLIRMQLADSRVIPSFLSLEWAFIADLDLESERYRCLGDMRFTVGALQRILNLRTYRGRISFLPADDMKDYKPKNDFIQITRSQVSSESQKAPYKSFQYLRPLDEAVPEDWLIIEDNFILFLIVNLPLISPDFLAAPDARFNDGNMHMMFMRAGASKAQLLKVLTQPGDKHHLDNPLIEFVKIKAFRLEPLGLVKGRGNSEPEYVDTGVLMVDGEQVPYGNIQGEIAPGLGRIFSQKSD